MNEIAREWVEKAENDFDAAELTLHGKEAPIIGSVVPAEMAEQAFESATNIRKYMRGNLEIIER